MRLGGGILRPGIVLEVIDKNGTIRCSVPGLFSKEDVDKLPPITPLLLFHTNQFSQPLVDDEVWVLNFVDNPQQLYWFRKDQFTNNNHEILQEENVEILCNRSGSMGWATIYFSNGSGWIIRNDKSVIQINKDGEISLNYPQEHRCIDINTCNISIGSKGTSAHPATYADKTEDLLWKIYTTFKEIEKASSESPYTANIGAAIGALGDWSGEIAEIKSKHVTID